MTLIDKLKEYRSKMIDITDELIDEDETISMDQLKDRISERVYNEKPTLGIKYDEDKPRWDLLPWDEIEDVVKVLTMGAEKYSANNWQTVRPTDRYKAAAMRHIKAAFTGEKTDSDSGLSHYPHAICCLLFLAWFERHGISETSTLDEIEKQARNM